jgi:radical SAM/Cys-rich protein
VLLMDRAGAEAMWELGGATAPGFDEVVQTVVPRGLRRGRVTTLQVNVGKLCNMACHHCHVDAGPKRTEIMPPHVAERAIELLAANPGVDTLDLTGGAPELNPSFRWMVGEARRLGRQVIDRCNLTVLYEHDQEDLAAFLAAHDVHVIASLPCYQEANVDQQRGGGAFAKSIRALRELNALGYGGGAAARRLDLVYNPVGAFLPPPQGSLEARYKDELQQRFGIRFDRLLTIANMPIKRFAAWLEKTGQREAYMSLLVNHFNPATVSGLMCRSLVSVGWDGQVYDCDFNQMLALPIGAPHVRTLWDLISLDALIDARVATGAHCFGCTAGAGSSCGGALQ